PFNEGLRLVPITEAEECCCSHGGVAQPAISVIPIEISTHTLGQGSSWCSDNCSGRSEVEQLQRQRAAHDEFPKRSCIRAAIRPPLPPPDRLLQRRVGPFPQ